MDPTILFADYLFWHYGAAFRHMMVVWGNLFWFVLHFFSIPTLLRTLFSPWKRITEEYQKKGLENFAETVLINIMTRVVGAIIRTVLIAFGLAALVLLFGAMVLFIIVWILAPLVTVGSVLIGLSFLF